MTLTFEEFLYNLYFEAIGTQSGNAARSILMTDIDLPGTISSNNIFSGSKNLITTDSNIQTIASFKVKKGEAIYDVLSVVLGIDEAGNKVRFKRTANFKSSNGIIEQIGDTLADDITVGSPSLNTTISHDGSNIIFTVSGGAAKWGIEYAVIFLAN